MFFGKALNWDVVWDLVETRKSEILAKAIRFMQNRRQHPLEALTVIHNFDANQSASPAGEQRPKVSLG